jgi:hypothetical protein
MASKLLLLFLATLFYANVTGNTIDLKRDTILVNGKVYALIQRQKLSERWHIKSTTGKEVIDIHYSHIDRNGKKMYIVKFLEDGKKGILMGRNTNDLLNFLAKDGLISKDGVNQIHKDKFLKNNPLPQKYTDIEDSIEY